MFVIFSVELLVLNRGNGGITAVTPPASGNTPAGTGSPASGQPAVTGNKPPASPDTSQNTSQPGESEQEPEGTRFELDMAEGMKLVLYVNEEIFEYTEMEGEEGVCAFTYKGNGTAALELRFTYLKQGAVVRAVDYLNEFFECSSSTVQGETAIWGSQLRGVAVTGTKDRITYEAWIHSFADIGIDDAGLAVIIYYQNDIQRDNLHLILDTLEMVPGTE